MKLKELNLATSERFLLFYLLPTKSVSLSSSFWLRLAFFSFSSSSLWGSGSLIRLWSYKHYQLAFRSTWGGQRRRRTEGGGGNSTLCERRHPKQTSGRTSPFQRRSDSAKLKPSPKHTLTMKHARADKKVAFCFFPQPVVTLLPSVVVRKAVKTKLQVSMLTSNVASQ